MTLYITGDIHGKPIERFSYGRNPGMRNLTSEDYVLVLGDFGVVWTDTWKQDTIYKLEWLNDRPWKTIAILGNHDNWDWALSLPDIDSEIGPVQQCVYDNVVYDNIYIIAKPTIITIDGMKHFCIPGAECHDVWYQVPDKETKQLHLEYCVLDPLALDYQEKLQWYKTNHIHYRVLGESIWANEAIDTELAGDLLKLIVDNDIEIDSVLSHDAPASVIEAYYHKLLKQKNEGNFKITKGQAFLQRVMNELEVGAFFHGHIHEDRFVTESGYNVACCLYSSFIEITKDTYDIVDMQSKKVEKTRVQIAAEIFNNAVKEGVEK